MKPTPLDASVLQIDPLRLDAECLRQPALFFQAAEQAAKKRARADELKSALEMTQADVDALVRARPEKYGITKVTEGAITKMVMVQEDVVTAREAYGIARYELDIAQVLVSALDQKKAMLGHLVSLHGQNYFSDVRPPTRAGREGLDDVRDDRAAEVTKRALGKRR